MEPPTINMFSSTRRTLSPDGQRSAGSQIYFVTENPTNRQIDPNTNDSCWGLFGNWNFSSCPDSTSAPATSNKFPWSHWQQCESFFQVTMTQGILIFRVCSTHAQFLNVSCNFKTSQTFRNADCWYRHLALARRCSHNASGRMFIQVHVFCPNLKLPWGKWKMVRCPKAELATLYCITGWILRKIGTFLTHDSQQTWEKKGWKHPTFLWNSGHRDHMICQTESQDSQ